MENHGNARRSTICRRLGQRGCRTKYEYSVWQGSCNRWNFLRRELETGPIGLMSSKVGILVKSQDILTKESPQALHDLLVML